MSPSSTNPSKAPIRRKLAISLLLPQTRASQATGRKFQPPQGAPAGAATQVEALMGCSWREAMTKIAAGER